MDESGNLVMHDEVAEANEWDEAIRMVALPLKIQPVAPQTIVAGKPLSIPIAVKDAQRWNGTLRFRLASHQPRGASIGGRSGEFSWMPPPDQPPGKYDITILVQGPDGQTAQTSFTITIMQPKPLEEIAVDLAPGVKLKMVRIPAGEFLMGSPASDRDASADEKPQHRVRITKPFYLGKYPVTQEQWKAVMGNNPSYFQNPKNPVENTNWKLSQQFVDRLNRTRSHLVGKFDLPTEAQWEYACRAGSTSRYYFGDDEGQLGEHAWYDKNSRRGTHPVGEKKPNAWGLYDMHGNVAEFCVDSYYAATYAISPSLMDDPIGPTTGSDNVCRGGGWSLPASGCRSAARESCGPGMRSNRLGLRVCAELGRNEQEKK